jgi:large subunit ribosomal protein L24
MKKKFSTAWKASKQPRKQRKYLANAPLHLKRKNLSVNISKDLRKKHGKRNISLRKGDVVKIMRGKFKKKQGKVIEIKMKTGKIYIEGMQIKKQDGSKANIPFRASNLQIIELNLEDKKRMKKISGNNKKQEEKEEEKTTEKKIIKEKATEKKIKVKKEKDKK